MEPFFRVQISDERAANVINEISVGSEPELRFYTMVAASTAIATFGLISNSTAVVIGAMLVAPLMTPIFGIALALIRGDATLLGRAVRAEIVGVILTIALAACFGFLMPELQATQEMLSRTKPNLLDLLVAVFAGFAGAYAMVDEHISPALPGVAIATAIVPPLANSGLCIALGAYYGALGSFLLFFANFLSILLVASTIFWASGMAREFGSITKKDMFRRFGLATFGFLIVAAFLSKGLYEMIQVRQLKGSINATLIEELSHLSATELRKVVHQKHEGKLFVLAHVHAAGDISPSRVKLMEEALESKLKEPVELFVRSTLSEDVSSTGSINQVLTETLDGFFVGLKPDPRIVLMKAAEQTIREFMDTQPALYVEEINLIPISDKPLILATIFGARKMKPEEIQKLELNIRQRTGDDTITLAIRHSDVELHDRFGKAYYEWATFQRLTPEQEMVFSKIEGFLRMEFDNSEYSLTNNDFSIRDGIYNVLVELTGPKLYSHEELAELRKKLVRITGDQLQVYVRSKPEVVLTQSGFTSFDKLQDKFLKQAGSVYKNELDKIIKEGL
jgi:uncharacterized hydrophobic protein (TIGR00271 family)